MEEPTQPTTKTCKHCGNEFEKLKHYRYGNYCSGSCSVKAARIKRKSLGNIQPETFTQSAINLKPETQNPATKFIDTPLPKLPAPTLPANADSTSAQFMLQWLAKDRDRYETAYNSERELRKKLRDEKDKLEKEFEKYKYEQQLEKISNSKPSGLQGISENPLILKLAEHAGPALGKILERLAEPGAPQLAGAENNAALSFAQWLATKQPETQQYLIKMLSALAQLPDEATLMQRISQIESIVLSDYMRATG